MTFYQQFLQTFAYLFVSAVGVFVLWVVWLYYRDKSQTEQAIRHNFPVVGRFRYLFEHWGTFFRQYFFALDNEELPFNRAQRSWVYRAAKNLDNTIAFGSTSHVDVAGTMYFRNGLFPALDDEFGLSEITFGPQTPTPYTTKHFLHISGMSFGAISAPAVKALSGGAKLAGIWLNTGEGGLSPYHLDSGCDLVFQIGTGKFGVCAEDGSLSLERLKKTAAIPEVKMFEIKLSQGAKPGKGGILPAEKVTAEIAQTRGIPAGKAAISPNRFAEIRNVEDLLDMIERVRSVTKKPTGIKLCMGNPSDIESLCEAILIRGEQAAPDFITLDSGNGGTGAAPKSFMDNIGMPIKDSLPKLVAILESKRLRERIRVVASGRLINPADVTWALAQGADVVVGARGFMFALGCIQALQCNKNTCPTGITTHDKKLQAGLDPSDKARRVANYATNLEKEVSMIVKSCGLTSVRQLSKDAIAYVST